MIDSFSGEYEFLSNFYPSEVQLPDGFTYPTVEHAFASAKTQDPAVRAMIRRAFTPGKAKRMGRQVKLRSDWEEIKFALMEFLLRQKFADEPLRSRLLATAPHELVEGNYWNDRVWGVCNGEGENHLGRLLMLIRDDLA